MTNNIPKEYVWFKHYEVYLKLFFIFITFRLCQYVLIWLSPSIQFDTSTILFLRKVTFAKDPSLYKMGNKCLWNKLLSWDSIFFIKGIVSELIKYPEFDFELMFSRLWVQLIRFLLNVINTPITTKNFYFILKFAVFVENILHFLSVIIIYHLTILIYSEKTTVNTYTTVYAKKVAILSAILFIFTSGSGFFISIYSEPLSFFLIFLGLWFREKSIVRNENVSNQNIMKFRIGLYSSIYYLGTIPLFTLAALNRPICVLLGLIYIYDLLSILQYFVMKKRFSEDLSTIIRQIVALPLLSGTIMLLTVVYNWYYIPFKNFCPFGGEWCNEQILKSVPFITKQSFYSFIQTKYWNIGFLKYWTLNNIPNFIIAIPQFIILLKSIHHFIINLHNSPNRCNTIIPLVAITIIFLFIILFLAHVQIINRVSSFIPLHLWYISETLISAKTNNQISHYKKSPNLNANGVNFNNTKMIWVKLYLGCLFFWVSVQTVLFGLFLPPA